MKCHSDSYARSPDLLGWGFRHVWGVLMPDNTILVRVSTLARIALNDLRKARENGSMAAIREARQKFDYYCDRLPRTSSPEDSQ